MNGPERQLVRRASATAAGAALFMLTASAPAQPTLSQPPWPRLQQGFDDVEPLAQSLAIQPLDLRAPSNFEDVYDLGDGRLARIHGNLIAVFPRSTYVRDAAGAYPTIPPGTVFYIGMPPALGPGPNDAFGRPALLDSRSAIARNAGRGPDRRASASRSAVVMPPSTQVGPGGPPTIDLMPRASSGSASVFGDETERRRLIGGLLAKARSATR